MLGERFLVLNGDVLCDLDLTALIEQHERTGARATIALYPVDDPSGYGLVHRHEDGEITEFLEKPNPDQIDTDEINAGAYLLERSVLERIPPDRAVSIEREIFPELIGDGLYGIRLEGYWIDIGTPERFLEANWDILERRVDTVTGERLDENGLLVEEGVEIGVPATLDGPAVIGARTEISPGAQPRPPCVLGRNCRIRPGAIVERSVLLDDCVVEDDAVVVNSILGSVRPSGSGRELDGAVIGEGERVERPGRWPLERRGGSDLVTVIGGDMLDAVRALPDHLRDALWRIEIGAGQRRWRRRRPSSAAWAARPSGATSPWRPSPTA